MKDPVEWILVMNETRARLVPGLPAPGVAAAPELVIRAESHNLRDVMAGSPGRSYMSASAGRRSGMKDGGDPLLLDKIDFVRQAFALVEAHRRAGSFDELTIMAVPGILGLVREQMPRTLRAIVRRELSRNLAGLTETALPEALKRAMEDE